MASLATQQGEVITSPVHSSDSSRYFKNEENVPIVSADKGPDLSQLTSSYSQSTTATVTGTTRVDGIGLWRSFTRNFQTPVAACLDLIDNCLDAASLNKRNPVNDDEKARITIDRLPPNGIILTNSSAKAIAPLDQVLGVFSSQKNTRDNAKADAIGENGVGLKQGCATLSDSSIVLSRNHNTFGLGFICKQLQTAEGCYLPSFEFTIHNDDGMNPQQIQDAMRSNVERIVMDNPSIEEVVSADLDPAGGTDSAIARLVDSLLALWNEEWDTYDHIFCLLITRLKHTLTSRNQHDALSTRSTSDFVDPAEEFLQQLTAVLPIQYLHVPTDYCRFHVDPEHQPQLQFTYWQTRLVELTRFIVCIPTQFLVHDLHKDDWASTGYPLSIYCGFDPERAASPTAEKTLGLYIYSRSSGRLIRKWRDGRGVLGLPNTGSDYSQGLTVLVDDSNGNLPLNPTKQDLAWSEQSNCPAHESNFYAWVAAVALLYWNYHADNFGAVSGGKKTRLTDAVKDCVAVVRRENASGSRASIPAWQDADYTNFDPISWHRRKYRNSSQIRASKSLTKPTPGRDTLFQWTEQDYRHYDKVSVARSPATKKRTRQADSLGSVSPRAQHNDSDDSDDNVVAYSAPAPTPMPKLTPIPNKRRMSARKSAWTPAAPPKSDISNLEEELSKVKRELADAKFELEAMQDRNNQLERQFRDMEKNGSNHNDNGLQDALADVKEDLEFANERNQSLTQQLEASKKAQMQLELETDQLKMQLMDAQQTIRKKERELSRYRG